MSTRNQRTNFFLGFRYHFHIYTQVGIGQPFFSSRWQLINKSSNKYSMRIPSKSKRERPCHTILQPGFLNRYLRDSTLLSSSTLRIQFKNRGGRGIIGDVASLLRYLIPCSFMYSKHLSSLTIDCSSTNDFIIRSKSTFVK